MKNVSKEITILHPQSLSLKHKISWFTVVGVIAAAVYILTALGLNHIAKIEPIWATAIAVVISAIVSYLGHYYLTFQVQGHHRIHGIRFTFQVLTTIVLNILFIRFTNDFLLLPIWLAATMFAILMPVANYLIYQAFTFRQ